MGGKTEKNRKAKVHRIPRCNPVTELVAQLKFQKSGPKSVSKSGRPRSNRIILFVTNLATSTQAVTALPI